MTAKACTAIIREIAATTLRIGTWSIHLLSKCTKAKSCVKRLMQLTEQSRRQRFCSIADAWRLSSTISQRCLSMHARLCSDLAYNCSNQRGWVLVGQMALFCGNTPWKALLCNHDDFSKLSGTFVDSRVTPLILGACHAWMAFVLWSDTSLAVKP